MKFSIILADSIGQITLEDVDDYSFDTTDATFTFVHIDETLTSIPRERIVLIKELFESADHSIN